MWKRFTSKENHLSFAQLLRLSDGEVSEGERRRAQQHLESCWACRAEMEKLQAAIADVMAYRDAQTASSMPPPTSGRTLFLAQLHQQIFMEEDANVQSGWIAVLFERRWAFPLAAALCVAAACAAFLPARRHGASAPRLLEEATQREAEAVGPLEIEHRTVMLEERNAEGQLLATSRIESWRERSRMARRLFDGQGHVIAGEWVNPDGSHVLLARKELKSFHSGSIPQVGAEDIWRLAPTPETFAALLGGQPGLTVEERPTDYVLHSATQRVYGGLHLVRTSLTLRHSDLHATEQEVALTNGGRLLHYRFVETGSERRSGMASWNAMLAVDTVGSPFGGPGPLHPVLSTLARPSAYALIALKLDALRRLDEVNSFSTDQIKVESTAQGTLLIEGVVPTKNRLRDVTTALGPIVNDPAATLHLMTAQEAVLKSRRSQGRIQGRLPGSSPGSSPGRIQVQSVEIEVQHQPLNAEIQRYLTSVRRVPEDQLQTAALQYSYQVLDDIEQAQSHALALRQLAASLPEEEAEQMSPANRAEWKKLLSGHARQVRQGLSAVRAELAPVFYPAALSLEPTTPPEMTLTQATQRLGQMTASADNLLWQELSLGSEPAGTRDLMKPGFWTSLANAERLAEQLQSY